MKSRNFEDFMMRDTEREIAHHERFLAKQQQSQKPPAPEPTIRFLDQVPDQPLTWLWPGRIPQGHLTLLDGAPGSGLSLVALTLAACISSGSPLPDGTPTQRGYVLLLAPYDSPTDTLKARFQAAGGDPTHLQLVLPLVGDASRDLAHTRPYAFPQDLTHLAAIIRSLDFRLLIIDPACAIPGLIHCLPALVELARQTNCAIVLTRSLRQAPLDPFHAPAPTSPLLQAARSRLLLAPDPTDNGQQLLLTTKHALCTHPATLSYTIVASQAGTPTIRWRGERDYHQLSRLCTGPIRSPYRQAILRFLQHSDSPRRIPDILEATSYDREAGRKMLVRMLQAGELVSPARGLYTTANHPCLLHFPDQASPVPNIPNAPVASNIPGASNASTTPSPQSSTLTNSLPNDVPNVPNVSTSQSSLSAHSVQSDGPPAPALPDTGPIPSTLPPDPNISIAPGVSIIRSSQNSPPAHLSQNDVSSDTAVSIPGPPPDPNIPNVSSVTSVSNPAHSTSEVAQQPAETAPASLESSPKGNGTS